MSLELVVAPAIRFMMRRAGTVNSQSLISKGVLIVTIFDGKELTLSGFYTVNNSAMTGRYIAADGLAEFVSIPAESVRLIKVVDAAPGQSGTLIERGQLSPDLLALWPQA